MTDSQQPLIDGAQKPRKIRKLRDDKGKKRKPDPTAREQALLYFAGLDTAGKQRFIEDLQLLFRFSSDPAFLKAFNDYYKSKSCTREAGHEGPCNGVQTLSCLGIKSENGVAAENPAKAV
jgi:hypothetical protein